MEAIEGVKFIISAVDDASATISTVAGRFGRLRRDVEGHFGRMRSLFRSLVAPLQRIGHTALWVGGIIGGIATAGAYKLGQGIIGATVEAETLQARIRTLFGQGAGKAWNWAVKFAMETPFELKEVIDQMATMKAYSMNPMTMLKTIGDTAAAMGGGDALDRITRALGQIQARTKVSAQEMLQLTEVGVPAWDMLARGIGKTVGEVMKLSEGGKISALTAIPILLKGMSERFGGGMSKMMDTIAGKWSNLKDAVWQFFTRLGQRMAPTIKGIIAGFTEVVNYLNSNGAGGGIVAWIEKLFSRENIAKVASFFGRIYDWGRAVFPWLAKTVQMSGQFIAKTFRVLIDMLGGPNGLWGAVKKVGLALLRFEQARAIMAVVQAVSSMVSVLAALKNPYAISIGLGLMTGTGIGILKMVRDEATAASGFLRNALGGNFADLTAQFGQFPGMPNFNAPLSTGAKGAVDAFMKGFDTVRTFGNGGKVTVSQVTGPLQTIAQNTSALVSQGDKALSQIYGGGPRAKLLSGRFAFGSGTAPQGPANITINIQDGNKRDAEVASLAVKQLLQGMRIPFTVGVVQGF